jgi:hypothetical protein
LGFKNSVLQALGITYRFTLLSATGLYGTAAIRHRWLNYSAKIEDLGDPFRNSIMLGCVLIDSMLGRMSG